MDRARRLFVYFNHRPILKGSERTRNMNAWKLAKRMQHHGLYAESTSLRSIKFSIIRKVYQIKRRGTTLDPVGHWHDWRQKNKLHLWDRNPF